MKFVTTKTLSILLYLTITLQLNTKAQSTGSFNRTVTIGSNSNWPISYYVPTSYNSSKKYKLLIGLHGLGSNSVSMRDYLLTVTSTNPNSPLYDCIIVTPDNGGTTSSDFWTAPCDTSVITKAMKDAMTIYNIDPAYVYLNGISLGGRAAMRYGLLNYWRFRGLELWCPAVQSANEANNLTSFKYAYQNAQYLPVCITVGSNDGYAQKLNLSMDQFASYGGIANYQVIHGMGHGAPPTAQMFKCVDYLNANASTYITNDAGISAIATPFDEECNTSFTPVVTIQNKGIGYLTSANIDYQLDNGTVNTYSWTGNLNRLERASITLPALNATVGTHTFTANTSSPNGHADQYTSNDQRSISFNVIATGSKSLSEGFEGSTYPPTGWSFSGTNTAAKWMKQDALAWYNANENAPGGYGTSAKSIYFDSFTADLGGKKYSIRTPKYDFTGAPNATLKYDYAYSPSFGQNTLYTDTFKVYYSLDCGATWTKLFTKGGMNLSTTGGYITKYLVPTASQWKTETINVSSLAGNTKVMFSFEVVSRFGNILYLDNINLSGITGIVNESNNDHFNVYPNPSTSDITIDASTGIYSITIMDITGNVIKEFSNVNNFPYRIERGNLATGVYFVELRSGQKINRAKLILE